jgi:hypothetical protein
MRETERLQQHVQFARVSTANGYPKNYTYTKITAILTSKHYKTMLLNLAWVGKNFLIS